MMSLNNSSTKQRISALIVLLLPNIYIKLIENKNVYSLIGKTIFDV